MRKGTVWCGLMAVGLALGAATASADDFVGFYGGAGFGSNKVEVDNANIDGSDFDDSDTGFKVFFGYSLNEFIAVELAYIDGGSPRETQDTSDLIFPGTSVRAELETKTVNLSAVGNLQLTENFALIGRAGYAFIDLDADVSLRFGGMEVDSQSDSETDEEISYGIGAVYNVTESFQLRAEYEGFDVADGELNFISLSGVFRFRL